MGNTEQLIAGLAQECAPVRHVPHPFALSAKWLAAAVAYLVLTLLVSGLRPDLIIMLQTPLFLAELGLLFCIAASSSLSAALLVFPDLHQKRHAVFAPAWMLLGFMLLLSLAWYLDNPPSPSPEHSFRCSVIIASLTLLPATWMFYSMRGFASTHPYLAGSIALLAAFSIGAISLRLSEHTDSIMHVIQWHYLPMVGAGMIGLWLGKKLLKW